MLPERIEFEVFMEALSERNSEPLLRERNRRLVESIPQMEYLSRDLSEFATDAAFRELVDQSRAVLAYVDGRDGKGLVRVTIDGEGKPIHARVVRSLALDRPGLSGLVGEDMFEGTHLLTPGTVLAISRPPDRQQGAVGADEYSCEVVGADGALLPVSRSYALGEENHFRALVERVCRTFWSFVDADADTASVPAAAPSKPTPGPLLHWDRFGDHFTAWLGTASDGVRFAHVEQPSCYRRGVHKLFFDVFGPNEHLFGRFESRDQPVRYYHSQESLRVEAEAMAAVLDADRRKADPNWRAAR